MNEFEAHEGSYDHQHRKRLKEMKQMTKDPTAAARAREAENRNAGLQSVSMGPGGAAPKKKKPVFKSTLQPQNADVVAAKPLDEMLGEREVDGNAAIRNGWAKDAYDPLEGALEYDETVTAESIPLGNLPERIRRLIETGIREPPPPGYREDGTRIGESLPYQAR